MKYILFDIMQWKITDMPQLENTFNELKKWNTGKEKEIWNRYTENSDVLRSRLFKERFWIDLKEISFKEIKELSKDNFSSHWYKEYFRINGLW
jgi:hypothetical protein